MIKDTRLHPFEVSFAAMVKKAKASEKVRVAKPRVKEIPAHIVVVFDEDQNRYGMFNTRLANWVREEYVEDHHTFRTPEAAVEWYRGLI
jgi:hypothetical protein